SINPFCFASEKKALENQGINNAEELNPRKILVYDLKTKKIIFRQRKFFALGKEYSKSIEELACLVKESLLKSVVKRIPENVKVGLLFSGGVDSTIIAVILKKLGVKFTCYSAGAKGSPDIEAAGKAAELHGLDLKTAYFDKEMVKNDLEKICNLIESNNVVKVGVAIPFFYAGKLAQKDKVKVLFSGLGSEELFAGYARFEKAHNVNDECLLGLKELYERDLYRDDVITMHYNIELRLPFLDYDLVRKSLRIPGKFKINNDFKKIILRRAAEELEVHKSIAWRKKTAAQYGSRSDKVLEQLSGPLTKSEFLRKFYDKKNLRLGVLYSSGKDSNLALSVMMRQNYDIKCLITMINENADSFMFHQPVKKIVELQSRAMNIPAIFGYTKGVKEDELNDLKKLIRKAKKEFHLDGVVTGALFSNYQRGRVKNVCEELGLKTFNPLWHKEQLLELKELLREGFEFILVKVAGLGFGKSWLNRMISADDLKKLEELNRKYGVNVAGEGGEYESLVLNAPFYDKKLKIVESEIVEDGENTAHLVIKKAELDDK
ncbi:ATP-binding protein, partial [archaeon CG_4_8_14_3_um_filter_38_5]